MDSNFTNCPKCGIRNFADDEVCGICNTSLNKVKNSDIVSTKHRHSNPGITSSHFFKWGGIILFASWCFYHLLTPDKKTSSIKNEKYQNNYESSYEQNNLASSSVGSEEQIDRELATFNSPFNNSPYNGTIDAVLAEAILFGSWAIIIEKGEQSQDQTTRAKAQKLKKKVKQLQLKEFPIIRKKYAILVAQNLWEQDIEVNLSGSRNTIISYSGALFSLNKNIKDYQMLLSETLEALRFKQTRYRWYNDANEYTYYNLETQKDGKIAVFRK